MKDLKQEMLAAISSKLVTGYENESKHVEEAAESVTQIAERLAVEFAEWMDKNSVHTMAVGLFLHRFDKYKTPSTIPQLFKLFKENDNG